MTTRDRAIHVYLLAGAFHVILQPVKNVADSNAGYATDDEHLPLDQRRLVVNIARVIDETTYAVALHELGHVLAPCGSLTTTQASLQMRTGGQPTTLRDVKLRLDEEEAAWEWAHHFALEWTPAMKRIERLSTNSYRKDARTYEVNL